MRVAVCVITCRRPEGLQRLLRALNALTFRSDPPDVEVIVVDNDADTSAASVCDLLRRDLNWPLRYEVEPQRGIPFARNRAVACAADTADFVSFIDDDEVPQPSWLDELLTVQHLYNADVVTGPVVPHFPEGVPDWVVKERVFELDRYPTGRRLDKAYTHNVLVRVGVFKAMETIFDGRMALTGGSDTHFFKRVHRAGFSIVWADQAVVSEWIPSSRTRLRWVLQRAYRVGNSAGLMEADLNRSVSSRVRFVLNAYAKFAEGMLYLPLWFFVGRRAAVHALRRICQVAGMLAGLAGRRYEEYRKIHGA